MENLHLYMVASWMGRRKYCRLYTIRERPSTSGRTATLTDIPGDIPGDKSAFLDREDDAQGAVVAD